VSSDGAPGRSTIRARIGRRPEGRHVIYESRLELARLQFAYFDQSVHRICAQPFLLAMQSNGVEHKHIPDYLLITGQGPGHLTPSIRRGRHRASSVLSRARGQFYE
jgi:hypothetical protein